VSAVLPDSNRAAIARRNTIANIVLPLDGSKLSQVAIPVARVLVELFGATAHLLYVGEQVGDPETTLAHIGVHWEQLPGAVVDQITGFAPEGILSLAKELPRSLIVMCTHTGHNRNPDSFGSVTEAVLGGNPDRILLIAPERGNKAFEIRSVVVAHDGTPAAAVAAGPAVEIANRTHADIIVVHVAAAQAGCPEELGSLPAPQYVDQPQHEWPSWAGEFSARMLALGAPASSVKFEVVVCRGQPGSEVAHLARTRKSDMIVMANPGIWEHCRHGLTRVVVRTSGCPVLLVRSEAA
jgi:nucleotide-binding universal stress UspA family protein